MICKICNLGKLWQVGQVGATFRWFHSIGGPIAAAQQLFVAEQQKLVFCTGNKDTTENIAIEWVMGVLAHKQGTLTHSQSKHAYIHTHTLTHTCSRLTQYFSHTYCSYTHFSEDPLFALMI